MENLDFLKVSTTDKDVLQNLSKMSNYLLTLKSEMIAAQEKAKQAEQAFKHYANVILPNEMCSLGITSLSLESGGVVTLNRKYYCQPNKNDNDKAIMAKWLREHNGSHLVESTAIVSSDDSSKLAEQNIPFVESVTINTNKLKAFLRDGVSPDSGTQQFTLEDIPSCMHFQEVLSVDITV